MDSKQELESWSANSIEPGQIARMCRLAWLYTGGNLDWLFSVSGRIRVDNNQITSTCITMQMFQILVNLVKARAN